MDHVSSTGDRVTSRLARLSWGVLIATVGVALFVVYRHYLLNAGGALRRSLRVARAGRPRRAARDAPSAVRARAFACGPALAAASHGAVVSRRLLEPDCARLVVSGAFGGDAQSVHRAAR